MRKALVDWPIAGLILSMLVYGMTTSSVQARNVSAVTELFYPYQVLDEDRQLSGYAVEVVQAMAKNLDDTLAIQILPWSVAYHHALETPDTLIFSMGKNDARTPLFHWIGPIDREKLYFWALNDDKLPRTNALEAFRDLRIAVVKDATTDQFLTRSGFTNLYRMASQESNVGEESRILMLIKGRADLMISGERAMESALKALSLPPDRLHKVYRAHVLDSELYLAFVQGSDIKLVERYQRAFMQLKQSGTLAQLQAAWAID
ncbi:transporter substrate-binding domain-containing protein [Aestuariibacter halophilus]|uniref:Transporter substrate-binding domain-containing protein n=1 Tax=Fluctibacter halophilus TaxID=226011 RepID=A0ABS8G9G8_9ALTE|nr:transporter substrate-binding domain-containing protein [Aestuariibacter halophilus]MCC2616359.1 transporter substrate-binding domain-containing protein [Aestuariibacter halophilus]